MEMTRPTLDEKVVTATLPFAFSMMLYYSMGTMMSETPIVGAKTVA